MTFYKLTDDAHCGIVVRADGARQEVFENGKWQRRYVMLDYFSDEGPFYDCYEIISESEANDLVAGFGAESSQKSSRRPA